ncbi:perlucin [Procambarus clarkii]|uniref:perlucin n=2 Tax=Procambarus clarkii TaxID=6728 RepID=UPI003742CB6A
MTACRIEDVPVAMCGREEVSMATCGREEVSMATWWHRETPMSMWKRVRLAAVVLMVVVGMLASPALGKKNVSSNVSLLRPQLVQSCPMAFHKIGTKCYFYGYFPLNWFRAAEFCHSFGNGVSLATIETAQENLYIKKWLAVNGDHNTGVWVGGSDNGHSGKWAWFPTGQLVDFTNWGPSQPSGDDQHCMYMVGGLLGYQWADFHCDFDMHFLCEHGVNTIKPWR